MAITSERILSSLEAERTAAQRGLPFKVLASRRQGSLIVLSVEPSREGGKSSALDESLEGSRAVWFGEAGGRGEVVVVDPERGEFTLRFVHGQLPAADNHMILYPQDFLTPLIELWQDQAMRKKAAAVMRRGAREAVAEPKALGNSFSDLRKRQAEAILLPLDRIGLLHGPPGTGKTRVAGEAFQDRLSSAPG